MLKPTVSAEPPLGKHPQKTNSPSIMHKLRTTLDPLHSLLRALTCLTLLANPLLAQPSLPSLSPPSSSENATKHFENAIRPILVEHCLSCHGPEKAEASLRLDRPDTFRQGGDSGAPVDPNWSDSLLLQAVKHLGPEMPPNRKLSDEQIQAIEIWVRDGAPWPQYANELKPKNATDTITPDDRKYWFFQPIEPLQPPPSNHSHPLDAFIQQKLTEKNLSISPNAPRNTLVRRLYLDLLGLPPTPEELQRISDNSISYEQLVDQLLQDPRYGERWARYWLDLVRFAESDGYKQDDFRPTAYRYRDYVIQAFNEDIPYSQFVLEQLAGDEIDPMSNRMNAATGYLRHWIYEYNQRDVRTQWDNILNDLTDVTGEVFLGMGFSCARCHDHKFDPILQQDYYQLQAFFAPIEPRYDIPSDQQDYQRWLTEEAAWKESAKNVQEAMQALEQPIREQALQAGIEKFPPDVRPILQIPEPQRPANQRAIAILAYLQIEREDKGIDFAKKLQGDQLAQWKELKTQWDALLKQRPKPPEMALTVRDGTKLPTGIQLPGKPNHPVVNPDVPTVLEPSLHSILHTTPTSESSGQRTALARWITAEQNPMPWRVLANRIWQHHFGKGLVANASDFGRLGPPPTHPELLDFLASELIDNEGRLKALHRLIVTSDTFKQSSYPEQWTQAYTIDSDNTLLWRFTPRRMDAEQIRDSILQAVGTLDPRSGGPSDSKDSHRRSIYQRILRNAPHPFLASFDAPDGSSSVAIRNRTTTPLQALVLTNSNWMLDRADDLAKILTENDAHDAQRVQVAFQRVLLRNPTPDEQQWVLDMIESLKTSEPQISELLIWREVAHALLNTNSFLYIE
jgi:cytochrome c553